MPAIALLRNQVGMGQLLQVKRQAGRGDIELLAKRAGGEARRTGDHEDAKDSQPKWLGECGQSLEDILLFHNSRIVEMLASGKLQYTTMYIMSTL